MPLEMLSSLVRSTASCCAHRAIEDERQPDLDLAVDDLAAPVLLRDLLAVLVELAGLDGLDLQAVGAAEEPDIGRAGPGLAELRDDALDRGLRDRPAIRPGDRRCRRTAAGSARPGSSPSAAVPGSSVPPWPRRGSGRRCGAARPSDSRTARSSSPGSEPWPSSRASPWGRAGCVPSRMICLPA